MHHENPRSESGALVAVHLLTRIFDRRTVQHYLPYGLTRMRTWLCASASDATHAAIYRGKSGQEGSGFVSPACNFCYHAIARANTTQHTCRRCASPSFWRAPRTCFFMVFGLMHNSRPNFLVRQAAANEFYQSSSRPVN
jgi:hypothetical protein